MKLKDCRSCGYFGYNSFCHNATPCYVGYTAYIKKGSIIMNNSGELIEEETNCG